MISYFIMVASDAETVGGATADSFDIAMLRLKNSYWPLHERTRNRKVLKTGDKVLIYCGGKRKNGKKVIASALISKISKKPSRTKIPEEDNFVTGNAYEILCLSNIMLFESPVDFKSLLPELSFCPKNMEKWGVVLHGGARRILAPDFLKIESAGQNCITI